MADENPVRRMPWATILLILVCCAVYFAVQPGQRTLDQIISPKVEVVSTDEFRFIVDNAAIPCEITQDRPLTNREYRDTYGFGETSSCNHGNDHSGSHDPGKSVYLALLISLFLHASPQHLFGNMLFLWVFGNNLEDRLGWWRYLLLYLVSGLVASFAHVLSDPNSTVPIIGASGAIAGLMGTYLVLYPAARIKTLIFFGPMLLRKVRASWLLLLWFAQQFLFTGSRVAYAAHIGGFAFGVLVGLVIRWRDAQRRRRVGPPPPPAGPSAPQPVAVG